ncbi:GNAT family N-acetyltransferase [Shewanella sp. WXL01]|uniref:GNAT family N-acetyltransferase n=1 Tax=Shewanella sp. WXL01 TaxID=2709721 RepID=UPI0014384727|nr:GNAT family protein [Shewanella sp. WXL01]NKF51793.1 GNAT family N-acetyltransferase [Shewanella sp. WXL01]
MEIALYTDRLKIRNLQASDWLFVLAIQTNPSVNQYIRDVEDEQTIRRKFEQRLELPEFDSGEWFSLAIERIDTRELVGITGFCCDCPQSQRAEVGYVIAPEFQGLGFASESLEAVIDWGAHQFSIRKFVAHCAAANLESQRVLQKSGFMQEGLLKQHTVINGKAHDDVCFGLLSKQRV